MRLIINEDGKTLEEINYQDTTADYSRVIIPSVGDVVVLTKGTPRLTRYYTVIGRHVIYHSENSSSHQLIILIVEDYVN